MDRRAFLKGSAAVSAVAFPLAARAPRAEATAEFSDEGVGIYTDFSVAGQLSSFTINRCVVSCGVGTLGLPTNSPLPLLGAQVGILSAVPGSGPFAMLMYATHMSSYSVERAVGRLMANGRMRSITRVGGLTVEDVEHDFVAIAVDGRGSGSDRFDVHFTTPFWNAGNPMCTPSDVYPGLCRFGGPLVLDERGRPLGDVNVAP